MMYCLPGFEKPLHKPSPHNADTADAALDRSILLQTGNRLNPADGAIEILQPLAFSGRKAFCAPLNRPLAGMGIPWEN